MTLFILAGPQEKYNEIELECLKEFVNEGGSLMVLLGENGESDYNTNINFLLEEFGMNINADSVIRPTYYKSFHPKIALVNGGVVCENMVKALIEVNKTSGTNLSLLDDKQSLEFLYAFGATMNVVSPSNILLTTSSVAYPFNRPLCGHFINENGGQILAVGSGHMFADKYVDSNMVHTNYFRRINSVKCFKLILFAGNLGILH